MRVITVAEAIGLEIGEKIPALRGQIKKIFDQTSGKNERGPWAIQNIELADLTDPRVKIKIKLFDQKEINSGWMNKNLYIESAVGERGGFKAVTLTQDTYKWEEGKPIKKLVEVRAEAIVGIGDGPTQTTQTPAPAQTQQPATPAQQTAAPAQQTAAAAQPTPQTTTAPLAHRPAGTKSPEKLAEELARDKEAVGDLREFTARAVNALAIIMTGVDHLDTIRKEAGRAMTPEQFQGLTTSIFISADRAGMVGPLPTGALAKYLPAKKPTETTQQ